MHQTRDVHFEFVTHGNHNLLNEENDSVLDRTVGAPELLVGGGAYWGVVKHLRNLVATYDCMCVLLKFNRLNHAQISFFKVHRTIYIKIYYW